MAITIPTYWIVGAVIVALVYFLEVVLPSWGNKEPEVELEDLKKKVYQHKEQIKKQQAAVVEDDKKAQVAIAEIKKESAKDAVATAQKVKDIKDGKLSTKAFLESEGFDVKEIFPK